MIGKIHSIRRKTNGTRQFVNLILNIDDDADLFLDVIADDAKQTALMSIHLPHDSAETLRNLLLDQLPIRRSMRDLLALADPID